MCTDSAFTTAGHANHSTAMYCILLPFGRSALHPFPLPTPHLMAPQVGVFRRGKYAGGKKVGKGNIADVGTTVKKGQTLGFVEQLGTFVPVEVSCPPCILCFTVSDQATC